MVSARLGISSNLVDAQLICLCIIATNISHNPLHKPIRAVKRMHNLYNHFLSSTTTYKSELTLKRSYIIVIKYFIYTFLKYFIIF